MKDLASQAWVAVQVVRDVPPVEVEYAEKAWKPSRRRLAEARRSAGRRPEHDHWDWTQKTSQSWVGRWRFVAIRQAQVCEGLMAVRTKPKAGQLTLEPVLYVDFIEVAPWNSRDLTDTPLFGGVGSLLLEEAVLLSLDLGWNGRIGLSALPQAKGFYSRLGMTLVDEGDPDYGELTYFEFDESSAKMHLVQQQRDKK